MPCGLLKCIILNNVPQFVAKSLTALCTNMGLKHQTTTTYHSDPNGKTEMDNQTLYSRLRHLLANYQTNWDHYIPAPTYAYNRQVNR